MGEIQGARLAQHWKNHGVSHGKQAVRWREPGKVVAENGMLVGEARGKREDERGLVTRKAVKRTPPLAGGTPR